VYYFWGRCSVRFEKYGGGEYQLISEAYVFGIMDGEFVEGDLREEMFCLC